MKTFRTGVLKVANAQSVSEIGKRIARLSRIHRGEHDGIRHRDFIKEGDVCLIGLAGSKKRYLCQARGNSEKDTIMLDFSSREELGVRVGEECRFEIRKATSFETWRQWNTIDDPNSKITRDITNVSLALSIIGLLIATWPVARPLFKSGYALSSRALEFVLAVVPLK